MKKMIPFLMTLVIMASMVFTTTAPRQAFGQMTAEVLPLNTMVTIQAPNEPVNRKTVPKKILRYCSFESQKVPDYLRVVKFQVAPGQKYTFYDCYPAPSEATKVWIYLSGDTPLTNHTFSYGRSEGFTRVFVTRGQQPWPMKKNEQAACDLVRHNITIAPQSEHGDLFVVINFNKPGASTKIMLKQPADSDDAVVKSTDRSRGSVWKAPFLLTNIPGEAASSVKPPVATPVKPTVATPLATTPPQQGAAPAQTTPKKPQIPTTPQPLVVKEAPATSSGAAVVPYNCKVQAYINRGDYDTFRFDFPGGKMRVASQGDLDIVADLWDEKGNRLARDGQDAKKDFVIEKELPPGVYYIQIRYMYHSGEGPYTLILGDGSGSVYREEKK
ncbi:MAG TPA: hypothetical protein PLR60_11080 [Syntrophorhabdaceae bacterium]|nr:hypothetical protein [Syntrophorhabdaceae bacterium]